MLGAQTMTLPANVSRNIVGTEMVLTTPYHAAVVEWAHQHGGKWDKERRAWIVAWSQAASDAFDQLCTALWPSGVATSQGKAWGPRRASHSAAGRPVSAPGSVETCAKCRTAPIHGSGIVGVNLAVCPDCWTAIVDYVRTMDASMLRQAAGQSQREQTEQLAQPQVSDRRAALRAALKG